ncbi:VWA domain-containing protein [Micromonospora haikouensis]|uniref:vWA domain-containing protein n=1 Tax=Micromonospora haikouensis TaxID=686309 RepID=UPI0037AC3D54
MQRVLPLYLAVDTSASMYSGVEAVQQALIQLVDELLSSPALGEQVRVGIVTFSDDAELVLPLTDMTELRSLPRLHARGVTAYGPLFHRLARIVERDLRALRARDTLVFRPFVFLITDGLPVDGGWERAFQEFDRRTRARLVVIAIGLRDEFAEVLQWLRPVAVHRWYDTDDELLGTRIFTVVSNFARSLTTSVMLEPPGRDEYPQLPPPQPPLGEADIR